MNSLFIESPVGKLKLKSNGSAIVSIKFVEDIQTKEQHPDAVLREASEQLAAYFTEGHQAVTFPLASEGTAFQVRVWDELRRIPFGTTISYQELAKRLGSPLLVRAVGRANGCNPIAIAVPCHRVIGSNGQLTGYAGGLHRKQWLLNHESKFSRKPQQLTMF